ncbi:MAG TPA: phage antirepressor N-terminal domain-containing protein [Ktedonobacterales bacterium]
MESTQPSVIRQVTRKLPEWGNLEIVALVTPDGVYFPLKLLCFVFLGQVNDRAQRARVQRDPILQGLTRTYPVETSGGRQRMVCLERLGIGRWINGVEVSRMRPEIRDRFLAFQWELTRLADRLLFGEVASEPQHALLAPTAAVSTIAANSHLPSLNEEQLATFLDFLARRVGSLEIDMQQIKRWQLALLQSEIDHEPLAD